MVVTVQFKNRFKEFCGRTYDYELIDGVAAPKIGDIIRMVDKDDNYVCNATRVKVIDVKPQIKNTQLMSINYVASSMED